LKIINDTINLEATKSNVARGNLEGDTMKRVIISLTVALLVIMNVRTWAQQPSHKSMQPSIPAVDMKRHQGNTRYLEMKNRFEAELEAFKSSSSFNEISLQMMADLVSAERRLVDALLASAPAAEVRECREERNWLVASSPKTVVNLFENLMDVATASKVVSQLSVAMLPRKSARTFLVDVYQELDRYGRVVHTLQRSLQKNEELSQAVDAGDCSVARFSPVIW
jgi:hypothetical protein